MKENLPKVLMLGWEFPPIINGGLGVACHDLSSAMSKFADITMVVPKSSLEFKTGKVKLVGANHMNLASLPNYSVSKEMPFNLHSIPVDLDPYYTSSSTDGKVSSGFYNEGKTGSQTGQFDIENLYGGDVIKKVVQFSDIAAAYASTVDFDVIHAHDWMTMIAGMRIKEQTGKPLVMHIHSLEVDRSGPQSKGWVYDLEKQGMEYADMLMPVSNFTAENIHQYYGIKKEKMSVVHNGSVAVPAYKSKKSFKEKTVLFVGRLTRQKGPEKFLDIAARVLEKDPNVRFVMAGTGDYFKSMLEQSSYKHIGNRFHMTGFLNSEKLRHLFSISDVYCMPSVSEPFGLSAVEAAQFGIPCVISKQSGVSEVLKGALTFDHWDIHKAADHILSLLNDQIFRKKIVSDAYQNLDNITWDISAQKIMRSYALNNFIN
ncbi:MAG: glycosyl transferase group 1 [Bacteroidota bacterium]|jgi:glycosyltransferase involved in cell wall biosynthesis|nr:glycosyl transferase group 1 [Bacteroidota bacterium]